MRGDPEEGVLKPEGEWPVLVAGRVDGKASPKPFVLHFLRFDEGGFAGIASS
ncbi:MAG: hypothetical protein QOD62_2950 [Actinomycetota bacterium]|nr:hypothetical protein [Actinomycetota bacterium]